MLDIRSTDESQIARHRAAARRRSASVVKDYFLICESYYDAIKSAGPSQIEAIDMGRRGLHNEGSELLRERLAGKSRSTSTPRGGFSR